MGEIWETLTAYEEDKRRVSTAECATADGDVSVKVRCEGGESEHEYMFSLTTENGMKT